MQIGLEVSIDRLKEGVDSNFVLSSAKYFCCSYYGTKYLTLK